MNRSTRPIRRADLAVSVVLILLLAGYTLAQFAQAQETANRVKCSSNLRMIGQALLLYSNDNKGMFPRTIMDFKDPKPTWGTPYQDNPKTGAQNGPAADPFDTRQSKALPAPNDITAAMFLLLRTQDLPPEAFVCPSTGQTTWDYGGKTNAPINWTNWPGKDSLRDHLSYSMQDPYPTKTAIERGWKWNNTLGAEYAVAADMNPGTEALLKLDARSPFKEMMAGNSINHNRDGQNVLCGDGHVVYEMNPFVGVMRDNIYTYGDSGEKRGGLGVVGPSIGPDDSVLLPTALELDLLDKGGNLTAAATAMLDKRAGVQPPKPEELAAAGAKIIGNFVRDDPKAGQLKLVIAREKITLTKGAGATSTWDVRVAGISPDGGVRLAATAPGSLQSDAITVWVDGNTGFITGPVDVAGKWTKQP